MSDEQLTLYSVGHPVFAHLANESLNLNFCLQYFSKLFQLRPLLILRIQLPNNNDHTLLLLKNVLFRLPLNNMALESWEITPVPYPVKRSP